MTYEFKSTKIADFPADIVEVGLRVPSSRYYDEFSLDLPRNRIEKLRNFANLSTSGELGTLKCS